MGFNAQSSRCLNCTKLYDFKSKNELRQSQFKLSQDAKYSLPGLRIKLATMIFVDCEFNDKQV